MVDLLKYRCQHHRMTEDELRAIIAEYDAAGAQVQADEAARLHKRDEGLRRARAEGMRPVDIMAVTKYSKETVRKALNPDARQNVNRAKKAAKRADGL